jgi:cysteine desulfurase / selenocysteine lyase
LWFRISLMQRRYLDNAATSFPKPPTVLEAMTRYATELGASPGRGAYYEVKETGRLFDECRQRINQLIHGEDTRHVIYTLNASDALNMAIRGIVHGYDASGHKPHVITTWLEHNSVLRPLNELVNRGDAEQTRVRCDPVTGLVNPDDIRKAIQPNTALIAVVHGSNVTGTLQPVTEIGQIAKAHDIPYLVDAAQTVGHVPIDVQTMGVDLLAFPGHKGLLGPLGTGVLYIRPGIETRMATYREGGTGSFSDMDTQPGVMPDRFEPGSHNAPGIIGLSQGVKWILDKGIDQLWQHHRELIGIMIDRLHHDDLPGLTLFGPQGVENRSSVFSIRIDGFDDPQLLSDVLEKDFGLLTRSGIHCAPLAHQTIGTADRGGTTRISLGAFNTPEDIHATCDSLVQICQHHAARVVS